MKFKREVAMVLNWDMVPLTTVLGSAAMVEFPTEFIWKMHNAYPDYIEYFVHTHPLNITGMSEEDRTTLLAWSHALYPHRIKFLVVTLVGTAISVQNYFYGIESLEDWRADGAKGEREVTLINTCLISPDSGLTIDSPGLAGFDFLKILLELSYSQD